MAEGPIKVEQTTQAGYDLQVLSKNDLVNTGIAQLQSYSRASSSWVSSLQYLLIRSANFAAKRSR